MSEAIEALRKQLEQMRPGYELAAPLVDGEGWKVQRLELLDDIADTILRYQPGDPAEKAVYLLAQAASAIRANAAPEIRVRAYRALEKRIREAQAAEDRAAELLTPA